MNKHQVKGVTNQVTGEVKRQVGKLTGDRSAQASGGARRVKGELQKGMGDAKEVARSDKREMERTSAPRGSRR